MATRQSGPAVTSGRRVDVRRPWEPLAWVAAGCVVFFVVPWVGVDLLELEPDLYYLAYFTVAVAFLAGFVRTHRAALATWWTTNLVPSLLVGAAVGLLLVGRVLGESATRHPGGGRFAFEIVWRGLVYGSVDACVLYVFPAAVAWVLMGGDRGGRRRKLQYAGLAVGLSLLVTAAYHLGYPEYRGELLRYPAIGAVAANIPTTVTGNALGALLAHPAMHLAAVVHLYEGSGEHLLPPRVGADYAARGSAGWAVGLGLAWLALASAGALLLWWRGRRRD